MIIHATGRGCYGSGGQAERGEFYARYGIASIIYDKAGTGKSEGDCAANTHESRVSELDAMLQYAAGLKRVDTDRLGVAGYSAGGWTVQAINSVAEVKPDFVITVVGPGTSVKAQQLDGATAYAKVDGYGEAGLAEVLEYTELLFTDKKPSKVYPRLMELLDSAKVHGWDSWLEDTDIPESIEKFNQLWVRRFAYDPAEDLAQLEVPFLGIFGGEDDVVPWQQSRNGLTRAFEKGGKSNYRIVLLPSAGHGMENGDRERSIPVHGYIDPSYYKFERVVSGAAEEIIDFVLGL